MKDLLQANSTGVPCTMLFDGDSSSLMEGLILNNLL
jgi:hypothetical protein